jgi:hypothetical protein
LSHPTRQSRSTFLFKFTTEYNYRSLPLNSHKTINLAGHLSQFIESACAEIGQIDFYRQLLCLGPPDFKKAICKKPIKYLGRCR